MALIGEVAPYVKPVAEVPKQRGGGTSTDRNTQRKRALKEQGRNQSHPGKPKGQGNAQDRPARPAAANRKRQRAR